MSMKVLLIDTGSKMPLPPLMKLSAWHKARGNRIYLNDGCPNPDEVYISCVFSKDAPKLRGIAKMFTCPVIMGGPGFGNNAVLPFEVEHIMPDYSLYNCNASIGSTTWGCFRGCPWCAVQKIEGWIRERACISEFHHPDHKKLILWDNNLLALGWKFKEDIKYITENGLKVSFNQGLDIRLINEDNAGILADTKYYDIDFNERRLYFSFDDPNIETQVRRGVEIFNAAGVPSKYLMSYFICGRDEKGLPVPKDSYDFKMDYNRFNILLELGVDPYPMKYNGRRDIRILNHFSRWVIRRDYKRKQPKFLSPREWQELQDAISKVEAAP